MKLHELGPAEGAKGAQARGQRMRLRCRQNFRKRPEGPEIPQRRRCPSWFEGGQMPLARRLPKRGFTNIFAKEYATVNVSDLEKLEDGASVDVQTLIDAGMIKRHMTA